LFLFWWKSEEHKVTSSWSQKVEISILGLLITVFRQKCEEHKMTSGWSQKGLNFNLRVIENRLSTKMWKTQSDIWWVTKRFKFQFEG
jgi:hypothetical protein